jgi:isopentenyl diphosphate isomerase/L-lactate dehydrogenase-like FMN-dependent dehydrogenase
MAQDNLGAWNIADLRELARKRLPRGLFEFMDRGCEDEVSLRNNRATFERIKLKPRVLNDVSGREQSITLFGQKQNMPLAIAPTGTPGIMWYEGELALARAAKAAGIPFTLATTTLTAMERVVDKVGGRLWFQLYMYADRALSRWIAERARSAGYEALIITVDSATFSNREYNLRNGFTIPITYSPKNIIDVARHPRWLAGVWLRYMLAGGLPLYENYPPEVKARIKAAPMGRAMKLNDALNWDDIREMRKLWPRTLLIKGVLSPQDAAMAADCGVDGVVVSNHGGRIIDGAIAPIDALPAMLDAVGKRMTVIVDSGFRRGSDVVKAMAMGAHAVLVGRATLYGVAAAGEAGGHRALTILREEIDRVMALVGCRSIAELNHALLALPQPLKTAAAV